ncbi:hypothetical protein F2Q69_00040792 [Brassica cretica]|uniref:Uncharacterized protein n=1 Tax=Brassica cretica TaxID=69181 RepID=A0A8S9NPH4_BRACR|nr:hypothetical protein F2Q69_00040792 [Brassica cretica]
MEFVEIQPIMGDINKFLLSLQEWSINHVMHVKNLIVHDLAKSVVCDNCYQSAQGVPDPNSDVRDPGAAPACDLFLVRDSIRQLASDDQGVPDQATKDVRDPIEATRSIPARVPFVSILRFNSLGGPIQQSSKDKR